jgi:hypothetical protein
LRQPDRVHRYEGGGRKGLERGSTRQLCRLARDHALIGLVQGDIITELIIRLNQLTLVHQPYTTGYLVTIPLIDHPRALIDLSTSRYVASTRLEVHLEGVQPDLLASRLNDVSVTRDDLFKVPSGYDLGIPRHGTEGEGHRDQTLNTF